MSKDVYCVRIRIKKPAGTIDHSRAHGGIHIPLQFMNAVQKYNNHRARKKDKAEIEEIKFLPDYIEFIYKIAPLHMKRMGNIVGCSISKWLYYDGWDALTTSEGDLFQIVECVKIFNGLAA